MTKRTHKIRKYRKRTSKYMKGGAFNQNEVNMLRNNGFLDNQIETLESLNISINEVMQRVNTIMNQDQDTDVNPENIAEQVMIELLNENPQSDIEPIPQDQNEINYLDDYDNLSLNDSQGSLHLSDLNTSNNSGYTTNPDESFNQSLSDNSIISSFSESDNSLNEIGGKNRKTKHRKTHRKLKKNRKSKNRRKTRKQKGGMCFGNGVGANSHDPNFSIYNTRQLELFPYRPK